MKVVKESLREFPMKRITVSSFALITGLLIYNKVELIGTLSTKTSFIQEHLLIISSE